MPLGVKGRDRWSLSFTAAPIPARGFEASLMIPRRAMSERPSTCRLTALPAGASTWSIPKPAGYLGRTTTRMPTDCSPLLEEVRQLGDIRRDPPRPVFGEQLGR